MRLSYVALRNHALIIRHALISDMRLNSIMKQLHTCFNLRSILMMASLTDEEAVYLHEGVVDAPISIRECGPLLLAKSLNLHTMREMNMTILLCALERRCSIVGHVPQEILHTIWHTVGHPGSSVEYTMLLHWTCSSPVALLLDCNF